MKKFGFYAMLDRMQYINRWALMRNSRTENIKEHSFDVAIIARALCVIRNHMIDTKHEALVDEALIKLDPNKVESYALYHDCTEIITGDLPTPIKYRNKEITRAYREVEEEAASNLASMLPKFMQDDYRELLSPSVDSDEAKLCRKIVKAADRISAYIKCITEEKSGNDEFASAKQTIEDSIMGIKAPYVDFFMAKFIPAYGMNLDQISKGE